MSAIKCITMEEVIKKHPELKMSDIEILREWCKKQPHLPKMSDMQLAVILHSNYYRIEPTKNTIDNYFTIRTHAPELFSNRDLIIKDMQTHKVSANIILKTKTKEGYTMLYSKLIDFEPSHYNFANELNKRLMIIEEHIYNHDLMPGFINILDSTGVSFGHIGRINLMVAKKLFTYVQEAFPIRLKAVHIINSSPITETLYNMLKPFINKELLQLVHFHTSVESAKEYIPVDALPNECGGKAGPIEELEEANVKKVVDFREWFLDDEKVNRVNESLRIGQSKTSTDFGVDGSFKKLELD